VINPIVYGMCGQPVLIGNQPVHYYPGAGQIGQIGSAPVHRGITGRPSAVGSAPVHYDMNSRTSDAVGGLPVTHDRTGRPSNVVGVRVTPLRPLLDRSLPRESSSTGAAAVHVNDPFGMLAQIQELMATLNRRS